MQASQVIRRAYDDVYLTNDIPGNFAKVDDDSIDLQLSLIFEELSEAITAFEKGDKVGVLDGAIDLFVTVAGLMQKLEKLGYGVAEALERVNANNLSKFPPLGTVFGYNPEFTLTYNEQYKRSVLKDANGKYRKPDNFVSVDLSDLVPKE